MFSVSVLCPHANPLCPVLPSYLVCAGDAQPVKQRQEEFSADHGHDGIGEDEEPEWCAVQIRLCRSANNSDTWHKTSREGQSHRHCCHLTAAQEKLITASLLASTDGLEQADARSKKNQASKHHIVPYWERRNWTSAACHDSESAFRESFKSYIAGVTQR